MKRSIVLSIAAVLAMAPTASARYLHVTQARPAAQTYITWGDDAETQPQLGRCWHSSAHFVICSYTRTGVTVCEEGQEFCDIGPEPGESQWFVGIAQRRDGLYAHTLWVDRHSVWVGAIPAA